MATTEKGKALVSFGMNVRGFGSVVGGRNLHKHNKNSKGGQINLLFMPS